MYLVPMRARGFLVAAAIAVATAGAYFGLTQNEYVDYDDFAYVVDDPAVSSPLGFATIEAAFRPSHEVAYWQPLTVLSFAVDHALFGASPVASHLENLLWHLLTALAVFLLLQRATGEFWRASAVAALFALHPIAVESVAWATERRTVLSAFLGLSSFLAYSEWARRGGRLRYAAALLLFAASLLAKGLLLPGAALLLALDFWPLRRSAWKRSVLEVVPFGAISAAVAATVLYTLGAGAGGEPPLGLRLENAAVLPLRQLFHLAWPVRLGPYYPYPLEVPAWQWSLSAAALLGVSGAALRLRRRAPYLLFGWIWFLAALAPTLGLKQGGQWAALADRHAYVASVGIFAAAAWGVADLARRRRAVAAGLGAAAAVFLAAVTARQVGFWRDSVALFERADEVADRADPRIKFGLGKSLVNAGQFEEGEAFLSQAIALSPGHYDAYFCLGRAYLIDGKGRDERAAELLARAIRLHPAHAAARAKLGTALNRMGRFTDTIAVLKDGPWLPEGRLNLGVAYLATGRPDLAWTQAVALGQSPQGALLRGLIGKSRP